MYKPKFKKDPLKLINAMNDILREHGYYTKQSYPDYLKFFKKISNKKLSEKMKEIN